ncbi:MAG TPA: protein kinase [Roseiflexaceae bacterium]|nr:protein kinase [Roseiflexaceae bacterium]
MQKVGAYELGEVIGEGGMGVVYRSFHPRLKRPVAVKLLPGDPVDDEGRWRYMREAEVLAGLSHPNIIRIFDVDFQRGRPYIVMELIDGGSLAGRMGAPMPQQEAIRLLVVLAEALGHAHGQGITHNDIKPANVLLRKDGTPVLADFDLARAPSSANHRRHSAPAYLAPEQLSQNAPVDARTDIYALGVLLFELLTGRLPFEGPPEAVAKAHAETPPPSPRSINPGVLPELDLLVLRMLAKKPEDRPQSADELLVALRAIDQGKVVTQRLDPQEPAVQAALAGAGVGASQTERRSPPVAVIIAVLAVSIVLLTAVLGGLWGVSQRGQTLIATPEASTPVGERSRATPDLVGGDQRPTRAPIVAGPLERIDEAPQALAQPAGPQQFSVLGMSRYNSQTDIWFFGEVRNDGDTPREQVEVQINLLDGEGNEVASESGYASLNYLASGEIAPFTVLFNGDQEPIPSFEQIEIEVRSDPADFYLDYTLRTLRFETVEMRASGSSNYELVGVLRNTGEEDVRFGKVLVVFYGDDNRVVGSSSAYVDEDNEDNILAAGKSAPFRTSNSVLSGQPVRYRVFAEGSRVD